MAETLTVNTTPDTATSEVVENLTPEEQDSLAVGEEIQSQQETLLAGKYKSAEELEKAYGELQRKLGEKDNEDSGTASETEVSESNEVSQEKKETSEDTQDFYLEDGNVNFEAVNREYGSQLGDIFKNSKVDPWAISRHFHDNNGTITEDMYGQLEGAGLARQTIDAYLDGRRAESGYATDDLTARQIDSVRDSVGGEAEYSKLVNWASQNLPREDIESFDSLVSTGNVGAIKLAVNGLKSQYENANGYEGRMLTGKSAQTSGDIFRSQAQLVEAMSDPRYENDPAYRQDVIEKLDRSDMKF
tara:strand:+ start:214 stop:1119 length:906 start_codon:yes stop_codon:yes gene_type:complete